jgi:hypothetical protein
MACSLFVDLSDDGLSGGRDGSASDGGRQDGFVSSSSPCLDARPSNQILCEDFENWNQTSASWTVINEGSGQRLMGVIELPERASSVYRMQLLTAPTAYADGGGTGFSYMGLTRAVVAPKGLDVFADVWIGSGTLKDRSELFVIEQNSLGFYVTRTVLGGVAFESYDESMPLDQWFRFHISIATTGDTSQILIEKDGREILRKTATIAWGDKGIESFTLGPKHMPYETTADHYRFDNVVVIAK